MTHSTADTGTYLMKSGVIYFKSYFPAVGKFSLFRRVPVNNWKLKIISADTLMNIDKELGKDKTKSNKTWIKNNLPCRHDKWDLYK
jgi:hypothetical protein